MHVGEQTHHGRVEAEDALGLNPVRGGAWNLESRACRAAARMGMDPESRRDNLGFRICRSLS